MTNFPINNVYSKLLSEVHFQSNTDKCLNMLNSNQFKKLDHDPTKAVENKIKIALSKIEHKLSKQDYIRFSSG